MNAPRELRVKTKGTSQAAGLHSKALSENVSAFQVPAETVCPNRDSENREERLRSACGSRYPKVSAFGSIPISTSVQC